MGTGLSTSLEEAAASSLPGGRESGRSDTYSPMRMRSIAAALVAVGYLFLFTRTVAAQSAIHVLVSNGLKAAVEELQPQCAREVGRPLEIQFNSTASVKKKIEAGETFDVSMITSEAIDDLVKQGKLASGSRAELGRSDLGIGIRAGAAKPDIRTPEGLKRTLLEAKSITYPQDGASRAYIEKMFERLAITAAVKPKIILAPGSGPATESVEAGKAALVITLFSEILPVHGVEILGPLPGSSTTISALEQPSAPQPRMRRLPGR